MDNINWSFIISLGSFIVAVVSLVKSFFTDRKTKKLDLIIKQQNVADRQQREENSRKAEMEANVVDTPSGKPNILRLYNKGESEALNVKMSVSSENDNDDIELNIDEDTYFPYPKLLPQQNIDIPYLAFSDLPHHTVKITWDDAFDKDRSKEIVLDL